MNGSYLHLSASHGAIPKPVERLEVCFPHSLVTCSYLEGAWATNSKRKVHNQFGPNCGHARGFSSSQGHRNCPLSIIPVNNSVLSRGTNWVDELSGAVPLRVLFSSHISPCTVILQPIHSLSFQMLENFYLICTRSFILIARVCLILLKLIYSLPLVIYPF